MLDPTWSFDTTTILRELMRCRPFGTRTVSRTRDMPRGDELRRVQAPAGAEKSGRHVRSGHGRSPGLGTRPEGTWRTGSCGLSREHPLEQLAPRPELTSRARDLRRLARQLHEC